MMSALAHVAADTLRSVAVFVAGMVADQGGEDSEQADSVSAIIVSFAIVLSCIPIVAGLVKNYRLLQSSRSGLAIIHASVRYSAHDGGEDESNSNSDDADPADMSTVLITSHEEEWTV